MAAGGEGFSQQAGPMDRKRCNRRAGVAAYVRGVGRASFGNKAADGRWTCWSLIEWDEGA